ncbi:MAG: hypothetical protein ACK515_23040 [bacterium]|nr:hypothetical protein [Betaproteobacteria bacterium]
MNAGLRSAGRPVPRCTAARAGLTAAARALARAAAASLLLACLSIPAQVLAQAPAQAPASPAPQPSFTAPTGKSPAAGQKPGTPAGASDPTHLIDGVGGIEWAWGPRETQATIGNKAGVQPTVLWIGRIVDVRIGRSVTGGEDGVLEFLAAYQPLIKPSSAALTPPIRLRPETGDHFVVSLRSPPVNEEMLKNLRQSLLDRTHYAVVLGEPRYIAAYGRHAAIFLQTRRATVTQALKIEVVRD